MTVNYAEMDNLWAFLGLGVVTVANLATTVIDRWRGRKKAAEREEALTGVSESVSSIAHSVNNRPDTTRDQLDRIEQNQARMERRQDELADDMKGVKKDVGRLADSVIDDRAMHHKDVERLDDDIDELRRKMT